MTGHVEERVIARLELACGHTVERFLLAKHRRMYVHVGRQFRCPVHDVMEVLVAVEETWVEGGGPGYRERLGE